MISERQVRRVDSNGKVQAVGPALSGNIDDNAPVIDSKHVFVCGHFANKIYALRRADLRLLWSYTDPTGQSPCPAIAGRKALLVHSDKEWLVFDKQRGQLLHRRPHAKSELPSSGRMWLHKGALCYPGYDGTRCFK